MNNTKWVGRDLGALKMIKVMLASEISRLQAYRSE